MKKPKKIAIYPGSFDPVQNGHLAILEENKDLFDKVICAIGVNTGKQPWFSLEDRLDMLHHTVPEGVEVDYFKGLLVDYVKKIKSEKKVSYITVIRGVRLITNFEEELSMAFNNKKLEPSLKYIFVPSEQEHLHISSTVVRDVSELGPDYLDVLDIPEYVKQKLKGK